jgi:hypothetical protein
MVPLPLPLRSVVVPAPVPCDEPLLCAPASIGSARGTPAIMATITYFIDRLMIPPVWCTRASCVAGNLGLAAAGDLGLAAPCRKSRDGPESGRAL